MDRQKIVVFLLTLVLSSLIMWGASQDAPPRPPTPKPAPDAPRAIIEVHSSGGNITFTIKEIK